MNNHDATILMFVITTWLLLLIYRKMTVLERKLDTYENLVNEYAPLISEVTGAMLDKADVDIDNLIELSIKEKKKNKA